MNESENNETVLPEKQVKRLRALLNEAETNLAAAKELLFSIIGDDDLPKRTPEEVTGKVIEGVFDGQTMHDADGKAYPVPANYASKSKLVEGDIAAQTEKCFENLFKVLAAAGLTEADVVKANVFLTDMANFAAMNAVYATKFSAPHPARSTIAVAGLPLGAQVEIELIARKG